MRARTPEQLANAIESLVASYLDEVSQVAQEALRRALRPQPGARRPAKDKGPRSQAPKPETKRRTAAELDATCEQLCALVRARPGEPIVTLAEEMGVHASTLQRPMAKLRVESRVRTVGERHLMRYFPAVARTAAAKG
jgi:DNA-binding NtrC family response regulator